MNEEEKEIEINVHYGDSKTATVPFKIVPLVGEEVIILTSGQSRVRYTVESIQHEIYICDGNNFTIINMFLKEIEL